MGTPALQLTGYTGIACYRCHFMFYMSDDFHAARRKDRLSFWCPNGHEQYFPGPTPDEQRIKALERTLADQQALVSAHRSRATGANISTGKAKAAHRRLLARVEAGVCPHCQRTFRQLAAHIVTQHGHA